MSNNLSIRCDYNFNKQVLGQAVEVKLSLELNNSKVKLSYYVPKAEVANEENRSVSVNFELSEEELNSISEVFGSAIQFFDEKKGDYSVPDYEASLSGVSEKYGKIAKYGTQSVVTQVERIVETLRQTKNAEFDKLDDMLPSLFVKKNKESDIYVKDDFCVFSFKCGTDGNYFIRLSARPNVNITGERSIETVSKKEDLKQASELYLDIINYLDTYGIENSSGEPEISYSNGDKMKLCSIDSYLSQKVDMLEQTVFERFPDFKKIYSAINNARETDRIKRQGARDRQKEARRIMRELKEKHPTCFDEDGNFTLETLQKILPIIDGESPLNQSQRQELKY